MYFVGKPWQDKVRDVRKEMKKHKVDVLVITMLDELACMHKYLPYYWIY